MEDSKYTKKRKIIGLFILIALLIGVGALTWVITKRIVEIGSAPEDMQEFIASFGYAGWLVALGIQVLQILVAFIPGELVESGMGYAFGAWLGTALCYAGILIGQTLVFIIIRKFGVRAIGYFVSLDKLDRFSFMHNEKRLKQIIFILFIIPGTPKDLLTYLAPLTSIKLSEFLTISLIARFPSVVSSTIGGNLISNGEYVYAAILYAVTGIVSLIGMKVYNVILNKKEKHHANTKSF
ncbi:MAG: TVP38/TMEM64 family protein [Clostridiales bacterium]|nr:TVP38/TMEM64 family protein [Clostridiales bacterium]